MSFAHALVLATLVLTAWAASGCWMLQLVAYPTYTLVAEKDFVPFHVDFGRRLIPVFVVPAVLACLAFFVLLFVRPTGAPMADAIVCALAGVVILGTTGAVEVPTHMALDREGKSQAKLDSLIRWNLSRAISWAVALAAMVHSTLSCFTPT